MCGIAPTDGQFCCKQEVPYTITISIDVILHHQASIITDVVQVERIFEDMKAYLPELEQVQTQ